MAIPVVLEAGKSRVFATAIDWPGWSRSGKGSEDAALTALLEYGARYRRSIRTPGVDFRPPQDTSEFEVVERLAGDATTEFGAPNKAPAADAEPLDSAELERLRAILAACWDTFIEAVDAAEGKTLSKGPRGGGRDVNKIAEHVTNAHANYLRRIFWRDRLPKGVTIPELVTFIKEADARALDFAISPEMPETGPRGGSLWKPRYFVRRAAWHILDHAWEIEDRIE